MMILAFDGFRPKTVSEIRALAAEAGVRGHRTWNISAALSSLKAKVLRAQSGWELNPAGKAYAQSLREPDAQTVPEPLLELRKHAESLKNEAVRQFVFEAIACCEQGLHRAAVVLSWVGAVAILYEHVVMNCLEEFNDLALKRDPKWGVAKNADGLARMKEADFLVILENLSVLGKSTKQELEGCLTLRNGCGHPNSLKVSRHRVLAHIEVLADNIYGRFHKSAA